MKVNTKHEYYAYDEKTNRYVMDSELQVADDIEKRHWKSVLETILRDWRLYVMLLPMIFVFVCWRYLPMYELLSSWKSDVNGESLAINQDFVGYHWYSLLLFGNYKVQFWQAFRNTFVLSFYGLLFGFPVPIIIALFFNEIRTNAYRSVLQVLTYLPKFISTVIITTLVWMLLSSKSLAPSPGILSQFLVKIHWAGEEEAIAGLMYQAKYFRAIYIMTGIWEGAGYGSIVYFAAIIAIDPTSYEAAEIDGAGKMAQMRYVVLPAILSTIVIMLIVRIGSLLSIGYEQVILMRHTKTYEVAQVMSTFAIDLEGANLNIASAPELINNIVSMILVIGANKISRKVTDTSLY